MSEQWKALSDDLRQPYLDRAAADKERYQHDKQQHAEAQARENARKKEEGRKEGGGGREGGRGPRELSEEMIFPLARIRRIMKLDPDVKTISKEAAMLVAKATVRKGGRKGGREGGRGGCVISPLARIRRIMKLDPDVKRISKEAAVLVAKATVRHPSLPPSPPPSLLSSPRNYSLTQGLREEEDSEG
jgi:hypothetical protein